MLTVLLYSSATSTALSSEVVLADVIASQYGAQRSCRCVVNVVTLKKKINKSVERRLLAIMVIDMIGVTLYSLTF